MLVACLEGLRVEAALATRNLRYHCPGCKAEVILKRGRRVCAHFAHKARSTCSGSRGETRAHLALKAAITRILRDRGLRAEPEYTMATIPWERRADVMVWAPRTNSPIAIELQRSALTIRELETRALSYCRMGVAQFWIAFLPHGILDEATQLAENQWLIPRYTPRQHELWIHGQNNFEGCWMADPETGQFWHASLEPHHLTTKEAIWYEMGAIKQYRRPTKRLSKRYRDLRLEGPFDLQNLKIKIVIARPSATAYFKWPGGKTATFTHD